MAKAKCKGCNLKKRHSKTTYIQTVRKEGERELPPEAKRSSHHWTILDAFYYCHKCIREDTFIRQRVKKELRRKDVKHKVLRAIPEMDLDSNDGRALPA